MDVGTFPLQLGFEGEIEKPPMETETGGSNPSRGKKRPPSPPGDDEELSESAPSDDDYDKWSVSDNESQGADCLCTLDDFPKAGCDFDEQNHILFMYPNIELLGPSPIRLYPAFKSGSHVFGSDYNLHDKSDTKITSVRDCSTKCLCAPMSLLQFIDINIAGYHHARPGPARIFGFVAARDTIEPLRNYVYKREISNYEAVSVKQNTGMARLSLTSPVRVISMVAARALMEFELYVRTEDRPDDEPKGDCLIEGCTEFTSLHASQSYIEHRRLYGYNCALDVKFAVLINAVEARIDIKVLRLGAFASGINLKVYAKTSGFREVIRLFEGAAPKPGATRFFVVAVETRNYLDLYIEGSPGDSSVLGQKEQALRSWWKCSFGSGYHCMDEQVAELGDFGEISVKVNWKSYRKRQS